MIGFFTLLLACQLVGEVFVVAFDLPIPGPVVGMVILFAGLSLRRGVPEDLGKLSAGILRHLSVLFVPAGVGIMLHVGKLEDEWLAVSAALVASAVATLVVTGLLMQWLSGRDRR
ncbi:MAG TPA: CidA/LrgA family protein [Arenicellales bacterium]|nr:CidA/LrgA family protein [Arenicellales bacterium]